MELVKNLDDIRQNIKTIDNYLQDTGLTEFAVGLIKRGTCFIAVKKEQGYAFYPSRYVGYKDNNYTSHIANDEKHGGNTNSAIRKILGSKPVPSEELEKEYRKFCEKLGFTASARGSFGDEHKYWVL